MSNKAVILRLYGDTGKPGFRPLLWRLVSDAGFSGWLAEENGYDVLRIEGNPVTLEAFLDVLPILTAPHYTLERVMEESREDLGNGPASKKQFHLLTFPAELTDIQPDFAPCPDCLHEVLDPDARRFLYPFSSCRKCGPSYSMMKRAPLHRQDTFFASFPPCRKCRHESGDPEDSLHFGSELSACPDCGPRLCLIDSNGEVISEEKCFTESVNTLAEGKILAVQSLYGGFQLFVDACNADAVRRLRKCCKIPDRPVTVMARTIQDVRRFCECGPEAESLLKSPEAPSVILPLLASKELPKGFSADLIAPGSTELMVSLPQTLLQNLLFEQRCQNRSGSADDFNALATYSMTRIRLNEATSLEEIYESLRDSADRFLLNDLPVGMNCPQSVAVVREGRPQLILRSRGYVPSPIRLQLPLRRSVIAFGTDLHASICLGSGKKLVISQPLGNLNESGEAGHLDYMAELYMDLFDVVPDVIACDMNTELLSSVEAARFADHFNLPLILVQTHHAHALSCMAENGLERALALVFDNGAPGPDGTSWGAELFDVEIAAYRRLGSFESVSLPGGENALKRPARQFAGRVISAGGSISPGWCEKLDVSPDEVELWTRNCAGQGLFSLSHAAVRVFDAFAAGLGAVPAFTTYRGQAANCLKYLALRGAHDVLPESLARLLQYRTKEQDGLLSVDWAPLFRGLGDFGPVPDEYAAAMAFAFHRVMAEACREMVEYAAAKSSVRDVVLSGSLFQNGLLSDLTAAELRRCGFRVFLHHEISADESGISAGQAFHAGLSN